MLNSMLSVTYYFQILTLKSVDLLLQNFSLAIKIVQAPLLSNLQTCLQTNLLQDLNLSESIVRYMCKLRDKSKHVYNAMIVMQIHQYVTQSHLTMPRLAPLHYSYNRYLPLRAKNEFIRNEVLEVFDLQKMDVP